MDIFIHQNWIKLRIEINEWNRNKCHINCCIKLIVFIKIDYKYGYRLYSDTFWIDDLNNAALSKALRCFLPRSLGLEPVFFGCILSKSEDCHRVEHSVLYRQLPSPLISIPGERATVETMYTQQDITNHYITILYYPYLIFSIY